MKAIFLDRDGVINEEVDFLHKIEDLQFIPGVIESLKKLSVLPEDEYKIVIVSNQPVLGRGVCTQEEFDSFMKKYFEALEKESEGIIRIDVAYNFDQSKFSTVSFSNCSYFRVLFPMQIGIQNFDFTISN